MKRLEKYNVEKRKLKNVSLTKSPPPILIFDSVTQFSILL